MTRHDSRQVTPFGHPGITARLTAPPGLSRPPTSFIGPWCQGIHRPPLPTYPQHTNHNTQHNTHNKMLASTMHISTHNQPTTSHPSSRPRLAPKQQPTPHRGSWLFLQDPTGCFPPATTATTRRVSPPETTGTPTQHGREHPGSYSTTHGHTGHRLRQRLHPDTPARATPPRGQPNRPEHPPGPPRRPAP